MACAGARAGWSRPRAPHHPARTVPSPALLRDPPRDLGHAAFQVPLVDDTLLHQQAPQRFDAFLEIAELVVELRAHFFARAANLIGAHDLGTIGAERVADD